MTPVTLKVGEKNFKNLLFYVPLTGMDQSKTFLPHFRDKSKDVANMWKLKMHVTGSIVHGRGVYGFFDMGQWPHASNLTITVLENILYMYRNEIPPTLYLQLDNCGRENKNRFVFSFCSLLVELGIFDKVKISFLMVGHTHEDVDQLFSRFSSWLKHRNAESLPALLDGFEKSYTPSPTAIELENVFNYSSCLMDNIQDMSAHSKPHVFKFTRNSSGRAEVFYKKWSADPVWLKPIGDANGIILKNPTHEIAPEPLTPDYDEMDLCRLKSDMERAKKYMSPNGKAWWDKWLQTMIEKGTSLQAYLCSDFVCGDTDFVKLSTCWHIIK